MRGWREEEKGHMETDERKGRMLDRVIEKYVLITGPHRLYKS